MTKGVADRERVVVTGQLSVTPGAKVHVENAELGQGGGPAGDPPRNGEGGKS